MPSDEINWDEQKQTLTLVLHENAYTRGRLKKTYEALQAGPDRGRLEIREITRPMLQLNFEVDDQRAPEPPPPAA